MHDYTSGFPHNKIVYLLSESYQKMHNKKAHRGNSAKGLQSLVSKLKCIVVMLDYSVYLNNLYKIRMCCAILVRLLPLTISEPL